MPNWVVAPMPGRPATPHTTAVVFLNSERPNSDTKIEKGSDAMMLLIVDDNAAMRRLIRRLTSDLAERIEECADGSEALAAYEEHQFGPADWVLMDIEMSGMDGFSATRQLRKAHPEARILIVTKHNDEQLRQQAFAYGASGFVNKENLLELRTLLNSGH